MDILYFLIPLALTVLGIAITGFIWAVKTGQFEDMQGPAHRILMDEDDPLIPKNSKLHAKEQDSVSKSAGG